MFRVHKLWATTTAFALLIASAVPASATPAPLHEIGIQAGAAVIGETVGALALGASAARPLFKSIEECQTFPDRSPESFNRLQRCALKTLAPWIGLGAAAAVGSDVGLLTALLLTANAQGHRGNTLAAALGALIAQAITVPLWVDRFLTLIDPVLATTDFSQPIDVQFDEAALEAFNRTTTAIVFLPVIAGVLAFNFL